MTTKELSTNLDKLNVTDKIQGYLTQLANPNLTEAEYIDIRYQFIKLNEKSLPTSYQDDKGNVTVGIGFNMDAAGAEAAWQKVFQGSVNFNDIYNRVPGAFLTNPQIRKLYDYSVSVREDALFGTDGIYTNIKDSLTANQKLAIEDLYFNGGSGLVGKKTSFYSDIQNYVATGNQAYFDNALEEVMDRSNSSFNIGLSHRRLKEGAMLSGNVGITQSEEEVAQLVAYNVKAGYKVMINGKSWTDYLASSETGEFKDTLQLDQDFMSLIKSELQNQIQQSVAINSNIQSYLNSFAFAESTSARRVDPLTLDLDGDGVELVNVSNSTAFFDLDVTANTDADGNFDGTYTSDGVKEQVGWVQSDDGLLTLDKNSNGTVDNILELFGKSNKTGTEELREYDLNNDGVINSSDAVFSGLKVWQDLNQDGESQADELKTLSELDIASINVSEDSLTTLNQTSKGNLILSQGSYTKTDGTTKTYANLDLSIFSLPMIRGYGLERRSLKPIEDWRNSRQNALRFERIAGMSRANPRVEALPIAASKDEYANSIFSNLKVWQDVIQDDFKTSLQNLNF